MKKLIEYTGGGGRRTDLSRVLIDDDDQVVLIPVLQNQLITCREEFGKHVKQLNNELSQLRCVHASTVEGMSKLNNDLKKELEEKIYYKSQFEQLKKNSNDVFDRIKDISMKLNRVEIEKENLVVRLSEMGTKFANEEWKRRDLDSKLITLQSTIESMESAYKELSMDKESQSAVLIGYHQRLESESMLYQTNAEALRQMYESESLKNSKTLAFYQSAYEEQVKRCCELSSQVGRMEVELGDKARMGKELENLRLISRHSVNASKSLDTGNRESIDLLEIQLKSAQEDTGKYKELAKLNEAMVEDMRVEMNDRQSKIEEMTALIQAKSDEIEQLQLLIPSEAQGGMDVIVVPTTVEDIAELQAGREKIASLEREIRDKENEIELVGKKLEQE